MPRFVTVDEQAAKHRAVLWEDDGSGRFAVVGRYASLEEVPGHGEVAVHVFDVPTTLGVGSEVNESTSPMVDADGAPLWEGARIKFCLQSHFINTYEGDGTFATANRYGGHGFSSEKAFPNWGPRGESRDSGHVRHNAGGEYVRRGDLAGYHRLAGGLGDPFEHGVTKTFVRLAEDPRNVCTLTFDPDAGPTP